MEDMEDKVDRAIGAFFVRIVRYFADRLWDFADRTFKLTAWLAVIVGIFSVAEASGTHGFEGLGIFLVGLWTLACFQCITRSINSVLKDLCGFKFGLWGNVGDRPTFAEAMFAICSSALLTNYLLIPVISQFVARYMVAIKTALMVK